jgi:hypothetical protein
MGLGFFLTSRQLCIVQVNEAVWANPRRGAINLIGVYLTRNPWYVGAGPEAPRVDIIFFGVRHTLGGIRVLNRVPSSLASE